MSEWQRAETWAQEQELAPEPDFLAGLLGL